MTKHGNRVTSPALLALMLVFTAGVALSGCRGEVIDRPNVLMIVIDTLRHDHMGCYGASRDTSPFMDQLAADGIRFERAYSTAPWTMPSVASMITGLFPASHGVELITSKLSDDALTLAEILGEEGYRTAGVVSHTLLAEEHNFHQGFDDYTVSVVGDPHADISTNRVTERAQALLEEFAGGDEPFFLLAHYFDPHYTYIRHMRQGFAPRTAGRLTGFEPLESLGDDLTPQEIDFLEALYDEEILFTDAGIGRLLGTLAGTGLDENTVIVVVGDHGEEFLEHGQLGHGKALYEESIRVPLIVRAPKSVVPRTAVVEDPVSLVSLTPTILDLVGLPAEEWSFQADSLAPMMLSDAATGPEFVFFAVDAKVEESFKKALATRALKIIRDDVTGEVELYDLENDPGELVNLAAERGDHVRELLELLDQEIDFAGGHLLGAEELQLSEEKLDALRSLGYVAD